MDSAIVTDEHQPPTPPDDNQPNNQPLRSPIRPPHPNEGETPPRAPAMPPDITPDAPTASTPMSALERLRLKMEQVASEFAQGKINRAQFNAMYGRYSEQRAIIERLLERNPDSKAWRSVLGVGGHTGFLRQHFEAQPLYFIVFRHGSPRPLIYGGPKAPSQEDIQPILRQLWTMSSRPRTGLARKMISSSQWMIMALGPHAVTLVLFMLEPSQQQAHLVRDLHADFERANAAALERGTTRLDRMVFPQRALVEDSL